MIYFIFSFLFLLGIAGVRIIDKANYLSVDAKVLESRDVVVRKKKEFSKLLVQHAVSYICGEEEKIRIVDCIPVRELDGTNVKLKVRRNTGEPVAENETGFTAVSLSLLLAAMASAFFGILSQMEIEVTEASFLNSKTDITGFILAVFGALFIAILLYDLVSLLNPHVICVQGQYEGFMTSSPKHRLTKFYSLWYGEFKQYARYKGFMIKDSEKPTTLFYNTLKGTVIKKADIYHDACLSVFIVIVVALYFIL